MVVVEHKAQSGTQIQRWETIEKERSPFFSADRLKEREVLGFCGEMRGS